MAVTIRFVNGNEREFPEATSIAMRGLLAMTTADGNVIGGPFDPLEVVDVMRMHLRRFTRLTNGFSKKLVNLKAAVALFVDVV